MRHPNNEKDPQMGPCSGELPIYLPKTLNPIYLLRNAATFPGPELFAETLHCCIVVGGLASTWHVEGLGFRGLGFRGLGSKV